MGRVEIIVLEMLDKGHTISQIGDTLKIKEDVLADIIINLDEEGFVILQDKQWIITEKGKDIFEKRKEDLKMLKVEYLHGEINKEEYDKRKKELEDLSRIIFSKTEEIVRVDTGRKKINDGSIKKINDGSIKKINDGSIKKIICPKCGTENKPESNYCRKCGTSLK